MCGFRESEVLAGGCACARSLTRPDDKYIFLHRSLVVVVRTAHASQPRSRARAASFCSCPAHTDTHKSPRSTDSTDAHTSRAHGSFAHTNYGSRRAPHKTTHNARNCGPQRPELRDRGQRRRHSGPRQRAPLIIDRRLLPILWSAPRMHLVAFGRTRCLHSLARPHTHGPRRQPTPAASTPTPASPAPPSRTRRHATWCAASKEPRSCLPACLPTTPHGPHPLPPLGVLMGGTSTRPPRPTL